MPSRIGFIGLGEMGRGMAKNLLKKGFDLTVFDIREEPLNELASLGARKARLARELAAASEVVFSMVRDDAQTQEVMWGRDGVLKGVNSGATIIITSTVSPSLCLKLAREAAKKGVSVLDCPVSGARVGAETGTLALMVGGDEGLFRKMEPVLQAISSYRIYLGPCGMGQVAKLANNMVIFSSIAATTEALQFAVKAGIPVKDLISVLNVSTGSTWVSQRWEALAAVKKDRNPNSTLNVLYRDLKLGLAFARELGIDLPLVSGFEQIDLWREVGPT